LFSAIKRFATSLAQADGLRDRPAVLSSNWKNLVKSAKRPFSVNRGARAPWEIFAQRYRAAQVPLVMNFSPLNRLLITVKIGLDHYVSTDSDRTHRLLSRPATWRKVDWPYNEVFASPPLS